MCVCWDGAVENPLQLVQRLRAEPRRRDAVDAAAMAALGLVLIGVGLVDVVRVGGTSWTLPGWAQDPWWHAAPLLLGCLALVAKRRRPVTTVLVVVPLLCLDLVLGGSVGMYVVLVDALYCLALHVPQRWLRSVLIGVAAAVVGVPVGTFVITGDLRAATFMLLQVFVLLATPVWWGLSVRQQAELAALAEARAEDLQHLAELQRERAVRDERSRMAQDLHDALSSHLSTIAIHSQVAGGRGPEQAGVSLAEIRTASLRALEDLREMILLLRTGEDQIVPAAGLADLDTLIARARGTGLTVEIVGESAEQLALLEVPSVVDQAAYRIVQESLANAAKHAPGARVTVGVTVGGAAGEESLELCVTCRGSGAGERHTDPGGVAGNGRGVSSSGLGESGSGLGESGSGLGLQTMRDRATTLGGTFRAGPEPDGSWVVRAELPLTEVLVG